MSLSKIKFLIPDSADAVRNSSAWGKLTQFVVGAVQLFAYIAGLVSTILLKNRVTDVLAAHATTNWHSYLSPANVPWVLWAAGAFVAARIKISRESQLDRKSAYDALKKFYDFLELGRNLEQDIRCTIWCPTKKKDKEGFPIQLEQWTHYVPKKRQPIGGNPNHLVDNAGPGRRRTVLRRVKGGMLWVGLLGKCVYECIEKQTPAIQIDTVPLNVSLIDHMVNTWNFDRHYAEKMLADRLSFMCIPVMDTGRTNLLGIIFIDSCSADPKVLSKELGSKAEARLPEIARVISK